MKIIIVLLLLFSSLGFCHEYEFEDNFYCNSLKVNMAPNEYSREEVIFEYLTPKVVRFCRKDRAIYPVNLEIDWEFNGNIKKQMLYQPLDCLPEVETKKMIFIVTRATQHLKHPSYVDMEYCVGNE